MVYDGTSQVVSWGMVHFHSALPLDSKGGWASGKVKATSHALILVMTTSHALRVDNILACTDAGKCCHLALCCTHFLMPLKKSDLFAIL